MNSSVNVHTIAFYSVIIPAYNAEKSIERCLLSILKWNYKALEILVIDDGSSDQTAARVESLASKEKQIRLIKKTNGGVSSARNLGLKEATGDYIVFLDADDYLLDDFFNTSIANSDFVLFQSQNCPNQEKIGVVTPEVLQREIIHPEDRNLEAFAPSSVWSKIYKNSIIKEYNLSFDISLSIGEDAWFNIQYLDHVKNLNLDTRVVYYYDTSGESITRSFKSNYIANDENYQKRIKTLGERSNLKLSVISCSIISLSKCFTNYYTDTRNHRGLMETKRDLEHHNRECYGISDTSSENLKNFKDLGFHDRLLIQLFSRNRNNWLLAFNCILIRELKRIRNLFADKRELSN